MKLKCLLNNEHIHLECITNVKSVTFHRNVSIPSNWSADLTKAPAERMPVIHLLLIPYLEKCD